MKYDIRLQDGIEPALQHLLHTRLIDKNDSRLKIASASSLSNPTQEPWGFTEGSKPCTWAEQVLRHVDQVLGVWVLGVASSGRIAFLSYCRACFPARCATSLFSAVVSHYAASYYRDLPVLICELRGLEVFRGRVCTSERVYASKSLPF